MKNPNSKTQQEQQDPATCTGDALPWGGARGQPLSTDRGWGWGPTPCRGWARKRDSTGLSATSPKASSLKDRRARRIYYPQRALGGSQRGFSFLPKGEVRPPYRNQRICWFFILQQEIVCFAFPLALGVWAIPTEMSLHLFPFFSCCFSYSGHTKVN